MNEEKKEDIKNWANSRVDLLAELRERRAALIRRFVEAPPCGVEAPAISMLGPIATIHMAIEAIEAVEAEAVDHGAGGRAPVA